MVKQVTAEKVKILFTDGKTWFSARNGLWEGRSVALKPVESRIIATCRVLVEEGLLAFPNPGEGGRA